MNQSLVAASTLFAPLGRFLRSLHAQPEVSAPVFVPMRWHAPIAGCGRVAAVRRVRTPLPVVAVHHSCLPLRVVRVMEAGQASALAGRILMSGRMADVCDELDRMVEREAVMQSGAVRRKDVGGCTGEKGPEREASRKLHERAVLSSPPNPSA